MIAVPKEAKGDVWYVYDGECPLCRTASRALRIREAVGRLHLINARKEADHVVIQEINVRKLDIDKGTVIKFGGNFYHGSDAMLLMAMLSTRAGWFNRMNAVLFRSESSARLCYPIIRSGRNLLLWCKGVGQIRNLEASAESPIFQSVFGDAWQHLPLVMHKHYAVRADSRDMVTVEGTLDVERSRLARFFSPLLSFCGALVPHSGKDVPVTVQFYSPLGTHAFIFDRVFHFPGHTPYRFRSRLEQIEGSEVVEFMRFGIGWRSHYVWDGQRVRLQHAGYVWRLFGILIPLPLELFIGKGDAWEEPVDDNIFRMWMGVVHPWFGKIYSYSGMFRVTEVQHG